MTCEDDCRSSDRQLVCLPIGRGNVMTTFPGVDDSVELGYGYRFRLTIRSEEYGAQSLKLYQVSNEIRVVSVLPLETNEGWIVSIS